MSNLPKRLMSEAARFMLAAVVAKQVGNEDEADWNRFLARFFCRVAESPDAIARLELDQRRAA